MFQEWFDINYETNENPKTIFEEYYNQSVAKINNRLKLMQNNGEIKNTASVNNDNLLRKVSFLTIFFVNRNYYLLFYPRDSI